MPKLNKQKSKEKTLWKNSFFQKNKKNKKLLHFGKWNFLAPSLKNSYTFSEKILYISGGNLPSPKNKKILSFSDDISENGSFCPQI